MASTSYPGPSHNAGAVTEAEYEQLVGRTAPEGVLGHPADDPVVYADGTGVRTVKVRAGRRALVRGFAYETGPVDLPIELPPNTSGQNRIDLVVFRLNRATWRVQESWTTGIPGQGAPPASQNDLPTGVWDIPIARVTVASGAGALAPTTVTPVNWYIGPDGNIRCTSTTRPPHAVSRRLWETDTERALISNGADWLVEYEDTDWDPLGIQSGSGWNAVDLRIRRRTGHATLQCDVIRAGTGLASNLTSILTTLPSGYRPSGSSPLSFIGFPISGGGSACRVTVTPSTGQVRIDSHSGFTSTGIMTLTATWPVG